MLDVGKIALGVAAGVGAVVAMWLAVRRQRTTEHDLADRRAAQAHTEADARERRITDLYTKSADQLGSDKAAVRLAGLYALERLAQDNPSQRQTIANVLCAYLRMPYTLPGSPPTGLVDEDLQAKQGTYRERVQEREVRLTAQRILQSHLRTGPVTEDPVVTFWSDLDMDLSDAVLIDFDLARSRVRTASFRTAQFYGRTSFEETHFDGAAWFDEARFFDVTSFESAYFTDGWFERVLFHDRARFMRAKFSSIGSFEDSEFRRVVWFDRVHVGLFSLRRAVFHDRTSIENVTFGILAIDDAVFYSLVSFRHADSSRFKNRPLPGPETPAWVRLDSAKPRPTPMPRPSTWPRGYTVSPTTDRPAGAIDGEWGLLQSARRALKYRPKQPGDQQ